MVCSAAATAAPCLLLWLLLAFSSNDVTAAIEHSPESSPLPQLQDPGVALSRTGGLADPVAVGGGGEEETAPEEAAAPAAAAAAGLDEAHDEDDFVDDSSSRRGGDRPRTTKRLYTTKRSMRPGGSAASGQLAMGKYLSLALLLLVASVFMGFRTKLFPVEDEEEEEDEGEDEA
ncbi:hypothetical protein, conserved [Eimeria tenella]|uniref:Uncharacterized protein n=1 Tax=Eimeria tenella TaxID=5802 RepID=H9B9W6_EIMTE|nr:hypothetical protein, conserved [Eimeria tenella]AET50776.1 hypothetical protein [Eimeria tenella]CDJ38782.1 hypothetical protein, conserved [Eimeria tenella]|eukprot:XP_013229538.1 hypothetical protein, conserved [Eimeria tenella]